MEKDFLVISLISSGQTLNSASRQLPATYQSVFWPASLWLRSAGPNGFERRQIERPVWAHSRRSTKIAQ